MYVHIHGSACSEQQLTGFAWDTGFSGLLDATQEGGQEAEFQLHVVLPNLILIKYTHRCNSQVLRNNMVLERSCTGGCERVVHLRFEAGQILHGKRGERQEGRKEGRMRRRRRIVCGGRQIHRRNEVAPPAHPHRHQSTPASPGE